MTEFSSSYFFSIQIVSNLDPFLTGVITQYLGDVISWKSHDETIGFTIWNGLRPTSRWPWWWKNNGKKSLLGTWLGYYPKLELHFSLFWHQNGRIITLRISKNMLPEPWLGGVIIQLQLQLSTLFTILTKEKYKMVVSRK